MYTDVSALSNQTHSNVTKTLLRRWPDTEIGTGDTGWHRLYKPGCRRFLQCLVGNECHRLERPVCLCRQPRQQHRQHFGISICEDIWNDPDFWPHRLYAHDPIAELVEQGA